MKCIRCDAFQPRYPPEGVGTDLGPVYCSVACAVRDGYAEGETAHVRVPTQVRDSLREIRRGKSHGATIGYLAGRLHRANLSHDVNGDGGRDTTTIRVSGDCHAVLEKLQERWDADSVGQVVGVLVAEHHTRSGR